MSNHLARRGALVALAALTVAIALFFVFDRAAPPTVDVDRSAREEIVSEPSASNSVELAPSTIATQIAAADTDEPAAPESTRAAVGAALDGRTWGDLIVVVDRTSGAPVADAHIAIIDTDGELRRARLDEAVLATDLAAGVLLALDAPTHVPRFFFAQHLANHTGAPRSVALHPSGALRLVTSQRAALPMFDVRVRSRRSARDGELDSHLIDAGLHTLGHGENFERLGIALRNLLDDSKSAPWRRNELRWIELREVMQVALSPDGSPTTAGWSDVRLEGANILPIVIDDLVAGVPIRFDVTPARASGRSSTGEQLEWRPIGASDWRRMKTLTEDVPIAAHSVVEVELRSPAPATVRGILPAGASAASARIGRTADLGLTNFPRREPLPTDRAFALTGIPHGRTSISLIWRTPDGAFATVDLDLALAPGEDRDLGNIDVAADSCELVIASSLVVDGGLDAGALDKRLANFEFSASASWVLPGAGDASPSHRHVTLLLTGPGEVVVRGLPTGAKQVSAHLIELPPDLESAYLLGEAPPPQQVTLGAQSVRVEFALNLSTAFQHTFRLNVPAPVAGSKLRFEALAVEVDGSRAFRVGFEPEPLPDDESRPPVVEGRALMPKGEWMVVAVARPSWEGSSQSTLETRDGVALQSFVGTTRFTSGNGIGPIEVDLALAAAVKFVDPKNSDPSNLLPQIGVIATHPVGFPSRFNGMWKAASADEPDSFVLWCLFPNTDYHSIVGQSPFRSGDPGSVTVLELR